MKTVQYVSILLTGVCLWSCQDKEPSANERFDENANQIQQYLSDNSIDAQQTASGVFYRITEAHADSIKPKTGEQVSISYEGYLLDGAQFGKADSTEPLSFVLNAGLIIPGLNEGVAQFRKGEKGQIFINSYHAFWDQGRDSETPYVDIPPYAPLRFDIKVLDIKTEDQLIREFIADSSLTATRTSSGLYYVEQEEGQGEQAVNGKEVSVDYTGYLLSGYKFDSGKSFGFKVGSGVISGFSEGISLMKKGGKALLIMPSSLAYGEQGSNAIPPYAPLIFEVKLVEVN
ncbi:peptidylprolyl isomerase [Catalinimonas alkaloidigena]|uniref:Peptidyl-prolyl cis-trans isomerase n=1 Tax=Catalinimonas alkaloidigena TaxID=1075417 RepID=A0A1G9IK61_9BACT|nr:FKBP-type peptidyl-prolyl cis-trans isomerase [Catalinimonas alkaloidigena]SDL25244.1 peptidylprolyl isomerase [Catalinimonas alkaloidigena]